MLSASLDLYTRWFELSEFIARAKLQALKNTI
jgi:hypothetical protein